MLAVFRRIVWECLEERKNAFSSFIDSFLIVLISLNVMAVIVEALGFIPDSRHAPFDRFNLFSIIIFTLEYVLRVWSIAESPKEEHAHPFWGRLNFMCRPEMLVDLVVIAPFFVGLFIPLKVDWIRALRLVRFFRLIRFWPKLLDRFLVVLISINVLIVVVESIPDIRDIYGQWFNLFYEASVILFTGEYFIRLVKAGRNKPRYKRSPLKDRLQYIFSWLAFIDILAVLPFYASFFIEIEEPVMLVLRLVVILKLTRYSTAVTLLLTVLKQESRTFTAALFIMLVIALFSSGVIFLVESKAQGDKFGSIPESLYWTMITLTTIGYGDVAPITPLGKFFAGCVAVAAIGIMALPPGILASAISDYIRRSRRQYEQKVEKAMRDGKITDEERMELEREGEALGIKGEEAVEIIDLTVHTGRAFSTCPHCGKPLSPNKRKTRTSSVKRVAGRR